MELFKRKNNLKRKLKNYPIILLIFIVIYFNLIVGFLILTMWLSIIFFSNKQIVVSQDALIFTYPNLWTSLNQEFKWENISSIIINEKGHEGYGGSPYLEIHYAKKDKKKKVVAFDRLDNEDFKAFTEAIKQCIGERNLDVISFPTDSR